MLFLILRFIFNMKNAAYVVLKHETDLKLSVSKILKMLAQILFTLLKFSLQTLIADILHKFEMVLFIHRSIRNKLILTENVFMNGKNKLDN